MAPTAPLSDIFCRWQRLLRVLVWLLAIEAALAGVIRARVLLGALNTGGRVSSIEATSALGLLMFPAMLYALVRLRTAQRELHVVIGEERSTSQATRVLLDTTTEGIYGIDVGGRCTMANRAAGELLGYRPEELIGQDMHALIHHSRADGSAYPLHECPINRAIRTAEGCEVKDELFWRRDGTSFSAAYSSNPVVDASGIQGAVVTFRDIEERKRMEQAVREAERRVLHFMEDLPIGVFVVDDRGHPVYSNRASQDLLGAGTEASLEGTDLSEAYGVVVAGTRRPYPTERLPVMRALSGETVTVDDIEVRRPDGQTVPLEVWAGPIRDAQGEIRYAAAAFTDVSARKAAEAALRKSEQAVRRASVVADREREAAQRANRAKSEFLSRMSHELRTPLNAILGFGQLLQMEPLSSDQADSVHQIVKAGAHLLELINEVLDISRIEAGRLQLSVEPVPATTAVADAVELMRPLAAKHEVSIEAPTIEDCPHYVSADVQRLKQVLVNLLSNAIKYNVRGGRVVLSCERTAEDEIVIIVKDTGVGIAADKLDRLFVPFDRAGAEQTTIEGTGLGLALSRSLVELMNGRMWAQSEPGTGSGFFLALPAGRAPTEKLPTSKHGRRLQPALGSGQGLLYIEDNLTNLRLVEQIMRRWPEVRVLSAMQGRLGLELALEHKPELVVLDLHLPDMPGEEVLQRLKGDDRTRDIPVIILTAEAAGRSEDALLEAGAAAYITKPIDVERFLEVLRGVLGPLKVGAY